MCLRIDHVPVRRRDLQGGVGVHLTHGEIERPGRGHVPAPMPVAVAICEQHPVVAVRDDLVEAVAVQVGGDQREQATPRGAGVLRDRAQAFRPLVVAPHRPAGQRHDDVRPEHERASATRSMSTGSRSDT